MDDLKERIIVSYVTLTVCIPGLAYWMERSGAAYPGNPAWVFVSTLRTIILGLLALVVGVGSFVGYLLLVTEKRTQATAASTETQFHYPPREPYDPQAQLRAAEELEARYRAEAAREQLAREERERIKAEKERAAKEAKRRLAEEKHTRSYAAAVEAALEEF